MKFSIIYIAVISLLIAQGDAMAATYPYTPSSSSTSTTTKSTTKPATTKTTKPTRAAAKPAPAPPPEESFFSNLSYSLIFISQSVDVTNTTSGATSITGSETGSGIGVSVEKFYKNKFRFNGAFSYVSYDNFVINSFTAAADYLMPVSGNLALFGGVAAGVAGQKYTNSSFSDMSMAMVYGAQLGGILFMNDNLMLELGYRLRITNLETEITTIPASIDTVDQLDEAYLGLIFSF